MTLSLAFYELATNAAKYGALSNSDGRVAVSWSQYEAEKRGATVELFWREIGGPPVGKPMRRGFGSTVIEQNAKIELKGEVSLAFMPSGVECRIKFSL